MNGREIWEAVELVAMVGGAITGLVFCVWPGAIRRMLDKSCPWRKTVPSAKRSGGVVPPPSARPLVAALSQY
jgi:hypothetical protein